MTSVTTTGAAESVLRTGVGGKAVCPSAEPGGPRQGDRRLRAAGRAGQVRLGIGSAIARTWRPRAHRAGGAPYRRPHYVATRSSSPPLEPTAFLPEGRQTGTEGVPTRKYQSYAPRNPGIRRMYGTQISRRRAPGGNLRARRSQGVRPRLARKKSRGSTLGPLSGTNYFFERGPGDEDERGPLRGTCLD